MTQEIPEPGTPQWNEGLEREVRLLQFRDAAKTLHQSSGWTPPPRPTSLADQLNEETPKIDYIFDGMWSGNLQLNAQKKAGKTTLMMNGARSLVTQTPFLSRFTPNVEADCRVAFLNMELSKAQFNQWFKDMDLPADAASRIVPYHGRQYGSLDFSNPAILDWLVSWFRDEAISIAFLDPLSAFYDAGRWGSGDPNASFLRWWAIFEQLVLEAKLRGAWIGHHSGLSEDAANRGRGASAMMDKPDMSMTLRYEPGGDGNYTDAPSDTKRFVSVFGRDVNLEEFEIDYDSLTRVYHATGGGSRIAQAGETWALKIWDAMTARRHRGAALDVNAEDLMTELGIAATGRQSGDVRRGRKLAVERGWVDEQKVGRVKLYRLGSMVPTSRGGALVIPMRAIGSGTGSGQTGGSSGVD